MRKRFAFTMLELIFVIVIMGILGTYGVEFLAKAYQNFLFTKINSDLQSKSEAAIEQIAKRLEHRIKDSVRVQNTSTGNIFYIDNATSDNDADVLEWIGSDIDGFRGDSTPLWSGVVSLADSNSTKLVSPGSDFPSETTLIQALSNNNATLDNAVLYFLDVEAIAEVGDAKGFYTDISGTGSQAHTLHPIQAGAMTNELLPSIGANFTGIRASQYYKLAWTAYAIQLINYDAATNKGDLVLHYDYQPWEGETFANAGKQVLLATDISAFRFRRANSGTTLKIQVCAKTDLLKDEGQEYALCKEKTIF